MSLKKILLRSLGVVLLAGLSYGIYYAWNALPIITGYGAKTLCSCVMLTGRTPDNVISNELGTSPLNLGSFRADFSDSSATATVFGLAKRKAIYRKGLGCTLVNEIDEMELRNQKFNVISPPPSNLDTIPWPAGDFLSEQKPEGVDYELLNQIIDSAFSFPDVRRTRAILVVYDGQILAEKYAPGFDEKSLLMGWSMTKSLTNALVGLLVREGKLSLNNPAPIEEWATDDRKAITLHNLMQASSGLEWEENYGAPSGATNMLFKKKDAGIYASHSPLQHAPGKVFYYSSGTTNIISWITRQIIGDAAYHRFPYDSLFHPIGMRSIIIEPDAGGTFVGSSFSYASARDWARFGLLYLNDGYWNGQRYLPEGWVEYSTTPAEGAERGQYGAQFWLNAGAKDNPENRMFPDVPRDLFWADGYEGQNVFILPSKNLVVVKLGQSTGRFIDDNKFLSDIISAMPD